MLMNREYWDKEGGEGAGGGGGTTAPLGSAAVPGDIPAPGGEEGVHWEGFADDPLLGAPMPADADDEGEGEVTPEPTPAPAPATPTPTPAPVTPPPTQNAAQQQPTPEEHARQVAEVRTRMRGELAGIYNSEMDEDTRAALLADPASVMPQLLAQAAMDGAQLAMRHMNEMVPHIVAQVSTQREGTGKAWGEFHAAHPDLAKPEYRQVVQTAIAALKASGQKPGTQQEAMAAVARTARAMVGLPQPGAATPTPTSGRDAPVAPHTPVARGRARPSAPAKANDNPWAEFVD